MADQRLIKRINRARIMNAIRVGSPISRSEIASVVGLDRKSITNLISELAADGLVIEVGKRQNGKGRPLTLLEFNREGPLVLGVSLGETRVTGQLLNLYGESVAFERRSFALGSSLFVIQNAVGAVFDHLHAACGSRLAGVGLSVPGIIDLDTGDIRQSVNLPALAGTNIRHALASVIPVPLLLEEGTRAKTLAEKWFGVGQDTSSFVTVDLGVGIGAGIVHDRTLYSDGMPFGGELGHIIITPNGKHCRCGHRGCLEAYISDAVLLDQINKADGSALSDLAELQDPSPAALGVIRDAGYLLGTALAYLVNIICPPLLVINGDLTAFWDDLLPEIERGIADGALQSCAERTRIMPSRLKGAASLGAAARALSEFFEVEGHFRI